MKLWTINKHLRKIGLVLTLITEIDEDGDTHNNLIIEKASTYDARIAKKKNEIT